MWQRQDQMCYENKLEFYGRINHLIVAFISLLLIFSACHILIWAFRHGEIWRDFHKHGQGFNLNTLLLNVHHKQCLLGALLRTINYPKCTCHWVWPEPDTCPWEGQVLSCTVWRRVKLDSGSTCTWTCTCTWTERLFPPRQAVCCTRQLQGLSPDSPGPPPEEGSSQGEGCS